MACIGREYKNVLRFTFAISNVQIQFHNSFYSSHTCCNHGPRSLFDINEPNYFCIFMNSIIFFLRFGSYPFTFFACHYRCFEFSFIFFRNKLDKILYYLPRYTVKFALICLINLPYKL